MSLKASFEKRLNIKQLRRKCKRREIRDVYIYIYSWQTACSFAWLAGWQIFTDFSFSRRVFSFRFVCQLVLLCFFSGSAIFIGALFFHCLCGVQQCIDIDETFVISCAVQWQKKMQQLKGAKVSVSIAAAVSTESGWNTFWSVCFFLSFLSCEILYTFSKLYMTMERTTVAQTNKQTNEKKHAKTYCALYVFYFSACRYNLNLQELRIRKMFGLFPTLCQNRYWPLLLLLPPSPSLRPNQFKMKRKKDNRLRKHTHTHKYIFI